MKHFQNMERPVDLIYEVAVLLKLSFVEFFFLHVSAREDPGWPSFNLYFLPSLWKVKTERERISEFSNKKRKEKRVIPPIFSVPISARKQSSSFLSDSWCVDGNFQNKFARLIVTTNIQPLLFSRESSVARSIFSFSKSPFPSKVSGKMNFSPAKLQPSISCIPSLYLFENVIKLAWPLTKLPEQGLLLSLLCFRGLLENVSESFLHDVDLLFMPSSGKNAREKNKWGRQGKKGSRPTSILRSFVII